MAKKINLSQVERFLIANDNAITKDEALDKIKKHPKGFFNLLKKTSVNPPLAPSSFSISNFIFIY